MDCRERTRVSWPGAPGCTTGTSRPAGRGRQPAALTSRIVNGTVARASARVITPRYRKAGAAACPPGRAVLSRGALQLGEAGFREVLHPRPVVGEQTLGGGGGLVGRFGIGAVAERFSRDAEQVVDG